MADLNSMIAQGAQFQAPIDPFAQYGKMQQLQQYQNQNELARYTMAKARQEDVTRNALNQAIQSNINADTGEIDYPGVYKSLAGANAGASIPGLQKSQFDLQKERAALDETKAKTLTANILNSRSVLTGVNDQASYDAWRQDTVSKIPQFAKVIPLTYSPETHAALLSTSEELAKRMDVERQRLQRAAAMGGGAPAPAAAPAAPAAAPAAPAGTPLFPSFEPAPGAPIKQGFSSGTVITTLDGQGNVVADNKPAVTNNIAAQVTPVANQLAAKPDQTSVITTQIQKLLNLGDPDSIRAANVLVRQLAQNGFTVERVPQPNGTEKFMKVNKLTGEATDVTNASGAALIGAVKISPSPLATLQTELAAMPPNSKQADEHRSLILKNITDTSQAQLKLAQDRFAWDKANPGYHIEALNNEDGSQRFVAVNKQTLKAYPITEAAIGSGKPPNVGAPLAGPAAGVTTAPVAAQTSGAPAMPGQPVALTSARPYKEPTVSEQNAGYNINRILRGATNIQNVIAKDPTALAPAIGEAMASSVGLSGAANAARTGNRQIVYGAQRDVIDALLYLATGAAYNKEQLAAQLDTYMPQYTDKPENILEKQQRLVELINDAKTRAGKAWTPKMDAAMNVLNIQSAAPGGVDANNPLLRGK